ncbi:MAG TPA: MlaD family protein [Thermoanaerobaculia bacterium]|nr:MlaD family protein [Thermoanaerobaculia bacterium]
MNKETSRTLKIGILVTASLVILMIFLFFIGSEQRIFSRKHRYQVQFRSAAGLATGNPVQLAGVTVGVVEDIYLPIDPSRQRVDIRISVEKKYAERIRLDSRARVKKLGLIAADSYIEITMGNPQQPALPPGSLIPALEGTDVDALIASGENLVDNFVQISHSLKNVLSRVDRGEGLLGELTTDPEGKQRITDTLMQTLNRTNSVLNQVQSGRGVMGRLLYDDAYAAELTASINDSARSMRAVLSELQTSLESGEGVIPALLNDPAGRERVDQLVENLRLSSENLRLFSEGLRTGEGLVPRLVNDREYGDEVLEEFRGLIARLSEIARKIEEGEGTAGRLISDPSMYEAVNDILIGINESRMLRYLIRNRQAAGIEQRYDAAVEVEESEPVTPSEVEQNEPDLDEEDAAVPPPAGW